MNFKHTDLAPDDGLTHQTGLGRYLPDLQQQVRNLDRYPNHSKTPFDSNEEPRGGFNGYIANSRNVNIFDDINVCPTTDDVFLTVEDVSLTADNASVAANVSTNIALNN